MTIVPSTITGLDLTYQVYKKAIEVKFVQALKALCIT